MIVPMADFRHMAERTACDGSMEVGDPIVAADGGVRYVKSIVELRNSEGTPVGWVYLAFSHDGGAPAEYVQGNRNMSASDRWVVRVRLTSGSLTSIARLVEIPSDLTPAHC